jgi:cytochrome c oxidase assembly protein subunit 11
VRRRSHRGTVLALLAVVAAMGGLTAASVPLYRLISQRTGYGGTPQQAAAAPAHEVMNRLITVRFNAAIGAGLPWAFRPEQRAIEIHPGEATTVAYRAVNRSNEPVTGIATVNVTPDKAGVYFDKLRCFCAAKQRLGPGQSADLKVSFFVDPAIVTDPDTADIDTITLSYTMFRAKDAAGPAASAAPISQQPVN